MVKRAEKGLVLPIFEEFTESQKVVISEKDRIEIENFEKSHIALSDIKIQESNKNK